MPQRPTPPPGTDQSGPDADHCAPPRAVRLIRGALFAEAALLGVAAVAVVVDFIVRGELTGRVIGMAAFLVVCALGVAWALLAAGRALDEGRRSARAVAMTWQLFQGAIAVTALATGTAWAVILGIVLVALAVTVAFLLLTPRVVEATTRR